MENIGWKFMHKFDSHWIKIKFFDKNPKLDSATRLRNVKFCEATNRSTLSPILLDRKSISCPGAQYAFGWRAHYKNKLLDSCYDKQKTEKNILKSMLSKAPYFKKPPEFIGLDTEDEPDVIMSYMSPEKIMDLIKIYHECVGKNLDVSLCSMMPICGGIAVRSYLEGKISISFGCNDSRKYADMRRENLAVGIPKRLINAFLD